MVKSWVVLGIVLLLGEADWRLWFIAQTVALAAVLLAMYWALLRRVQKRFDDWRRRESSRRP
jgi:cell division protein FtsW (lipid II flippase)